MPSCMPCATSRAGTCCPDLHRPQPPRCLAMPSTIRVSRPRAGRWWPRSTTPATRPACGHCRARRRGNACSNCACATGIRCTSTCAAAGTARKRRRRWPRGFSTRCCSDAAAAPAAAMTGVFARSCWPNCTGSSPRTHSPRAPAGTRLARHSPRTCRSRHWRNSKRGASARATPVVRPSWRCGAASRWKSSPRRCTGSRSRRAKPDGCRCSAHCSRTWPATRCRASTPTSHSGWTSRRCSCRWP